jgi:hypothetical protein
MDGLGPMTYGTPHPEILGVRCDSITPNHPECSGWDAAVEDYIDWSNPEHVPPKKVHGPQRDRLREMAGRTEKAALAEHEDGFSAGEAASTVAAGRWTPEQIAQVDEAIRTVAEKNAGGGEFTSDAIWAELAGGVPVTKGLTARLMHASRRRILDSTGKTAITERRGHHDHGQRLTIWYSLL